MPRTISYERHSQVSFIYRKEGFQAIKKGLQDNKTTTKNPENNSAWGATFKNRNNFVNMHFC